MLQNFQEFILFDDATFAFLWIYLAGLLGLFAISALTGGGGRKKPTVQTTPESEDSRSRERPRLVQFGIDLGMGFVRLVANSGVTPNQITVIGLVLVAFNCLVFALTANTFALGSGLIAALLFDTLDGLVARAQGTSSRFGGYLDAVIDRYEEVLIYLTLGAVLDLWLEAFLVVTGSMLVSYNKARVAIEAPVSNKGWSDVSQKPLRLFILCFALIGNPIVPWFLAAGLWLLIAMSWFTGIQRLIRAYFLLRDDPR
jgi:phosphatidylglycerophosphate synthase